MNAVILGCGRVGAAIAAALDDGNRVTIVDWNPHAFARLPEHYSGRTVVGNGIDVDCLRSAGVGGANVFLALTDSDNRNLMAAQVARHLGARQSVARVYDAERGKIFSGDGLTIFSPTVAGADRLFGLVLGNTEE